MIAANRGTLSPFSSPHALRTLPRSGQEIVPEPYLGTRLEKNLCVPS